MVWEGTACEDAARDLSPPAGAGPALDRALDTERHVAGAGWDQPPRLFALVGRRPPGGAGAASR